MRIFQIPAHKVLTASVLSACLLLSPSTILQAQSSLPTLGDDTSLSLGSERRVGDQIARELMADPSFLADPVLDDYVQSLWQPLVAAAKQRGELAPDMEQAFAWRLFLLRDKSVNAFALPGGYFGVHLGLLGMVDSPDELASVLAHELTHATQRHIARGLGRQNAQSPLILAGTILALLAASRSTNRNTDAITQGALAATQAAGMQSRLNFSRDMEREADRIGFTLMEPAGYAPSAFVSMFNKLVQSARLNDSGNFPYLRSHPLTTERIADMSARLAPGAQTQTSRQAAAGHSEATGQREATGISPALHALMTARARVLSDLSIGALTNHVQSAQQPLALADPRANKDNATERLYAGRLYAGALAAGLLKERAQAGKLYTQLVQQLGERVQPASVTNAVRWLAADLQLEILLDKPLTIASNNRTEMLYAAELATRPAADALTQASAISRLQLWLSAKPLDPLAWDVLARLQLAQNQTIRAAMSQGEAARSRLDDSAALAQYQSAQSFIRQTPKSLAHTVDTVDAAIVDSKVRELQRRIRDLQSPGTP